MKNVINDFKITANEVNSRLYIAEEKIYDSEGIPNNVEESAHSEIQREKSLNKNNESIKELR